MTLRRTPLALACAVALVGSLSACGTIDDYKTDDIYTPGAGTIYRDGTVDVLSAVIVAAAPDSGTFVAGLSNKNLESVTFESFGAAGTDLLTVEDFETRDIPAQGFTNLAEPGEGIEVTGDFEAGEYVTVELGFSNGESASLEIPVVTDCDMWEGIDAGAETAEEAYDCEPLEPVKEWGPGHSEGH